MPKNDREKILKFYMYFQYADCTYVAVFLLTGRASRLFGYDAHWEEYKSKQSQKNGIGRSIGQANWWAKCFICSISILHISDTIHLSVSSCKGAQEMLNECWMHC